MYTNVYFLRCFFLHQFCQVESFVIDQEFEEDPQVEAAKFLLSPEEDRSVDPETQARLEALLQAAGKY